MFTVTNIPNYREHYMKTYPLSSRRIDRAMPAMSQYIKDLALGDNQDGNGHAIGNANDTYGKVLAKLELAMYKYLYMGWNREEYQMVIEG